MHSFNMKTKRNLQKLSIMRKMLCDNFSKETAILCSGKIEGWKWPFDGNDQQTFWVRPVAGNTFDQIPKAKIVTVV